MNGAVLAAEIDAMLATRPDLSRRKIGYLCYGNYNGVDRVRERKSIRPETVARIRAIIDNPPDSAKVRTRRPQVKKPCTNRGERISRGMRKAIMRRAQERINAGLSAEACSSQTLKFAQRELEAMHRENGRLSDPVEQAKLRLQRARYAPVCSMAVYGGDPALFRVGRRLNLPAYALLKLAEAA